MENHMNNIGSIEFIAETRRDEIVSQMGQIRLEQHARLRRPQTGLYGRGMLKIADWMIAAGRDLRCRYDFRSSDCGQNISRGFAR
jgi:hypothetical protein